MGLSNSVHLRRGGDEASDGGGAVTNAIKSTKFAGSDAVTINIRRSNATKFAVQVSLESSVESFKSVIAKTINVPVEQQHLVYKGWYLKDDRILKTYGMETEHTVHLVGGLEPVESDNTENEIEEGTMDGSCVGGSSSLTDDIIRGFQELYMSCNKIYSRFGMSGILLGIIQLLFQNPNLLPETIYQLTNNPESMRIRIFRHPQLRQVIDRFPDMCRVVYSPVIFHDLAQTVVYFELIREMQRIRETGGGRAPVSLRGNEIEDPEGMLYSVPELDIMDEIMENPHIMTIQTLLTHPINSNRELNPKFTKLLDETYLRNRLGDLENMQQIMVLQELFPGDGQPDEGGDGQLDEETDVELEKQE